MKKTKRKDRAERGGWLRLHRKFRSDPRYADSEHVHIWVHLLLNAAFRDTPALFDGKAVILKPGQLITSRGEICELCGVSEGKVKRVLDNLRSDQQIDQRAGKKHSLFTVRNWAKHQGGDPLDDQLKIGDRSVTDRRAIGESDKTQAGVRGKGPKKPRSKEGGEGVESVGAAGTVLFTGLVPTFRKLPANLFPAEYKQLREEAERQIEALRADPRNVVRSERLTDSASEDLGWLAAEALKWADKPDNVEALGREAAAIKANPASYRPTGWKPEVKEALAAWRRRVDEITAAMSGRVEE
jgi:hypothetical protein